MIEPMSKKHEGKKGSGKSGKSKKKSKLQQAGPSTDDALAVLKLYELRRERVMRASRDTLLGWTPTSVDDVLAMTKGDHPDNAAFRQVLSYFEMAFGLARRGAVHPELLVDWCGEGILHFAKLKPFLGELRKTMAPTAFSNAEWVTENTEAGAAKLAYFLNRFSQAADDQDEER